MIPRKNQNQGMTLPELVLAIFMLIAFTGFTVMIVRYTARFFQPLNEEAKEEFISSGKELQDILNDQTQINNAFDSIIEILSEPGIKKDYILNLECTSLPSLEWNIPSIDTKAIPKSYKICLKPTSLSRVVTQGYQVAKENQEFTFFTLSQIMVFQLMRYP